MSAAHGRGRDAAGTADQDTMDIGWLETAAYWSKIAAVTGAVLAALGTGFAVYFSSRMVATRDADLERLRGASTQAVAAAEARADQAARDAAAAQAAVAAATERASRIELEASRDRVAPPQAELTAAVPATAVPGRMSHEKREAMVSILKRAREPRTVELSWAAQTEPYARARELQSVLVDSGWHVNAAGGVLSASPPTGVSLAASVLSDDALLLQSAFDAGGMRLRIVLEPGAPEHQLRLTVGAGAETE